MGGGANPDPTMPSPRPRSEKADPSKKEPRDEKARPAGPAAAGDPPPPAVAKGPDPDAGENAREGQGDEGQAEEVERDLDALLADARRERDEYLELAKRTKADFENFRKRMAGEAQAAAARGKAELARELIEAVDNLERALQAAGVELEGDDPAGEGGGEVPRDGFSHGVLLVFRGLRETLARNGIETLDPKGERFDPQWHEALSTQPTEEAEAGVVLEVMQKGYRLDNQLIRPARVVVSQ